MAGGILAVLRKKRGRYGCDALFVEDEWGLSRLLVNMVQPPGVSINLWQFMDGGITSRRRQSTALPGKNIFMDGGDTRCFRIKRGRYV